MADNNAPPGGVGLLIGQGHNQLQGYNQGLNMQYQQPEQMRNAQWARNTQPATYLTASSIGQWQQGGAGYAGQIQSTIQTNGSNSA